MTSPFDPTTSDRKEWDRLAASKWLPPIVQKEVKSEAPVSVSTANPQQGKQLSRKSRTLMK